MIWRSIVSTLLICMLGASFPGCTSIKRVTHPSELSYMTDPIRVLTKDGSLYRLKGYFLRDSLLIGSGSLEKPDERRNFQGQLKISDIEYIQASKINTLNSRTKL